MSKFRAIPIRDFLDTPYRIALALLLAAVALFTLTGCVTRSLGNDGLAVTAAPADGSAVGEMVVSPEARALGQRIMRFGNRGTAAEHQLRRKDAERAMATACAGDYVAGSEGPEAEGGIVRAQRADSAPRPSDYWYIQFRCVHVDSTGRGRS